MPFLQIQIGEPTNIPEFRFPHAVGIKIGIVCLICVRNDKLLCAAVEAEPHHVIFQKRKNFFIGYSILVSDDEKLLSEFHQLCHIFSEERKRRVGDDDVRLSQQVYTLGGAEVPVAVKQCERVCPVAQKIFDIRNVSRSVRIEVVHFGDLHPVCPSDGIGDRLALSAEDVELRIGDGRSVVRCGNELLQSQSVEIQRKIFEKVALIRVIAVAEHCFPPEMLPVVLEFALYIGKLSIKLVILLFLGVLQSSVCHNFSRTNFRSGNYNTIV